MGMKPGSVEWAIEELKTTDWKWMSDQMERQYHRWHKNIGMYILGTIWYLIMLFCMIRICHWFLIIFLCVTYYGFVKSTIKHYDLIYLYHKWRKTTDSLDINAWTAWYDKESDNGRTGINL